MAGDWHITAAESGKAPAYIELHRGLEALLSGETHLVANLANVSAALFATFGWHWVGFYLVDAHQDNLVLGPFQGPVACTRLFRGKGVCAAAWETNETVEVPDVEAFPGHVACSSASLSEVVVPIRNNDGDVVAVLDVDSAVKADFTPDDVKALESLAGVISSHWNQWTWQP